MGKQKLKGKELRKIGFPSDQSKSLAINIIAEKYKHLSKTEKLDLLKQVLDKPENFLSHEHLGPLAELFSEKVEKSDHCIYQLNEKVKPYKIYGSKFITSNAIHQMDIAMRLPIAEKGALMPDAHVGYGLPIGGVLATKNEVIPYAIGLDIGCRMAISIFDAPVEKLNHDAHAFKLALKSETHFGLTKTRGILTEHEVLERPEFEMSALLKQLKSKAAYQLGTSGSGNHFVEFGEVSIEEDNSMGLEQGSYTALVSHSGSRGFGATVANYFSEVARDKCRLPEGARHLAWLDMDKAEGMEYWLAMNLAGDYAKACHDVIHDKLAKSLGLSTVVKIENHHNFAWKEKQLNGEELIVHRKGATPAKKGELGFIPGSMTAKGYIVSGKGNDEALNSASHGAGRKYSRTKTKNSFTGSAMRQELKKHKVTLIGGGLDEAPFAYKDIETVMKGQVNLVNVEGVFTPRIVRMCKP